MRRASHPDPADALWRLCPLCGAGFRGHDAICTPCLEAEPEPDQDDYLLGPD